MGFVGRKAQVKRAAKAEAKAARGVVAAGRKVPAGSGGRGLDSAVTRFVHLDVSLRRRGWKLSPFLEVVGRAPEVGEVVSGGPEGPVSLVSFIGGGGSWQQARWVFPMEGMVCPDEDVHREEARLAGEEYEPCWWNPAEVRTAAEAVGSVRQRFTGEVLASLGHFDCAEEVGVQVCSVHEFLEQVEIAEGGEERECTCGYCGYGDTRCLEPEPSLGGDELVRWLALDVELRGRGWALDPEFPLRQGGWDSLEQFFAGGGEVSGVRWVFDGPGGVVCERHAAKGPGGCRVFGPEVAGVWGRDVKRGAGDGARLVLTPGSAECVVHLPERVLEVAELMAEVAAVEEAVVAGTVPA